MAKSARLKTSRHSRLPWRINEIAPDFKLIDAWALPARGTLDEFADLLEIFANFDAAADDGSRPSRALFTALFALRAWLGQRLGWDEEINTLPIPGCEETSLRERLPDDLAAEKDDTVGESPFRPVYRTKDEWAIELSNGTVHAILHLGWVPRKDGTYSGQMGVYVKPRGRFGPLYMALIAPFRHLIVYPALMRRIGRAWKARARKPVAKTL
jgi:hypothetical protein